MIKSTTRFVSYLALFLIPFFALIVANSFFFPFITGKGFYFRILVEIAFASWLILACMDPRYRPKLNWITIAVSLFAVITLVADLVGVNALRSLWSNFERMEGWLVILHLWMFYIVAESMFNADWRSKDTSNSEARLWWRRWFNVWLGVSSFLNLYAFLQLLGVLQIHQGDRVDATLGNAAYFAVYMLFSAAIAVFMYFEYKREKTWKVALPEMWIYWTSFVVSLIFAVSLLWQTQDPTAFNAFFTAIRGAFVAHTLQAIIFLILVILSLIYPRYLLPLISAYLVFETATRGTILGLIGGIMLALFLYAVFGAKSHKRSRIISGSIIGVIVLLGVAFWLNRDAAFIQANTTLRRLATISLQETQTQARAYIWPMAITGWTERPILGWGQENFNYIFNANYNPKMWSQEQWFDRAHSVFLDWLVASGIVGFLAYILLYVFAFIYVWKSHLSVAEKSVLSGLFAAYAVHNVFVFDNLASYVGFFAMLAFVSAAVMKSEKAVVVGGNKVVEMEILEYITIPATVLVLIAFLYFLNVKAIKGNTSLISALMSCQTPKVDPNLFENALSVAPYMAKQEIREQTISCASSIVGNQSVPSPVRSAMLTEAQKAISDQIAAAPKDARMYVLGGQFINNVGQFGEAQSILEKAHLLTPGKQGVNFELANNYINTGKVDQAVALLKQAYEADPTYPQAASAYAMGLVLLGREKEAHDIFGNDPKIFGSERMAQIYASNNLKQYDKALAIYNTLLKDNPKNLEYQSKIAQIQYMSGNIYGAIAALRQIQEDHPEVKEQVEAAIKSLQK